MELDRKETAAARSEGAAAAKSEDAAATRSEGAAAAKNEKLAKSEARLPKAGPELGGVGAGLAEKLRILGDAAKYDAACTSSGVNRNGRKGSLGNAVSCGLCHSFAADGRCISLLKILMTNECIFDCRYCLNRSSNDVPRATFTPEEICRLTIEFYRRNYIEGLFLSSGIIQSPDRTMELLYETVRMLRQEYHFNGYIHVKGIPGADDRLISMTGFFADRMSVNLELPTADALRRLAPHKNRKNILRPMRLIQNGMIEHKDAIQRYRHAPQFVPAGQSTQMIVGAARESDFELLSVAAALYEKYRLKRVFYSAYVSVNEDRELPAPASGPPLLREHRLYQADWLLRYYGFDAKELLSEDQPNFNVVLDPKCDWALRHLELFPMEINKAGYYELLRIPGIGVRSAKRIVEARRTASLDFPVLRRVGVVLKRAVYFITCRGKQLYPFPMNQDFILRQLLETDLPRGVEKKEVTYQQLSLFDDFHMER